jgi:predicted alpha-1,2-mannosidase
MRVVRGAMALVLLLVASSSPGARADSEGSDWAAYVDPFIGTGPAPSASYGQEFDGGDVFPGATWPAGMLYWSPDTAEHTVPGGYFSLDHTLKGFSLTHFSGRGCTVYGDVPMLPALDPATAAVPASFSHVNESASPGAYRVTLDDGINVELTVTPRTGLGRITWPTSGASSNGLLRIDAAGSVNPVFDTAVEVDSPSQRITGHVTSQVGCGTDRYTLYFAIAFDRPFTVAANDGRAVLLAFDASQPLLVKPAISYVSAEGALANLAADGSSWDFDAVRAAARSAWNAALGRVAVSGGSNAARTTFYTALYHAYLHPNLFSDADGSYLGFDDQVHRMADGHAHYHNIPGWDEYRSLVPLRAILAPDQMSDIIQSLVDDAQQGGGGMPRWEQANRNSAGMVGDSPGPYVAGAYAFGARDFSAQAALRALDFGASDPAATSGGHAVREYLEPWLRLGYVPEQPSITLEYAIDDFAIAQFAAALGAADLHDRYAGRAAQWRNTFNPGTAYIESRDANGGFPNADHSHACCGFVEGNAAQYTWMVPFDGPGLVDRLGGHDAALARLDDLFRELNAGPDRPHAWIGNEPSLWAPWAYNVLGEPSRTQATVRRIELTLFDTTPGGLPGNDDGGTTSAWYVFAALGLFPTVPGADTLTLGSPLFPEVRVHLASGGELRIVGNGAAPEAPYVSQVRLNGAPLDCTCVHWRDLESGGTLEFDLSATPGTA